jgi:hypothetical protein
MTGLFTGLQVKGKEVKNNSYSFPCSIPQVMKT